MLVISEKTVNFKINVYSKYFWRLSLAAAFEVNS